MSFPRKSVTVSAVLAIGISAVWLVLPGRHDSNPTPVIVDSNNIAAITSGDRSSNSGASAADVSIFATDSRTNCCGTPAVPPTPSEIERQNAARIKQSALFAEFDSWADRYAAAGPQERAEMLKQGIELSRQRREVMTNLIKSDPKEAIEAADKMSPLARQELPAEVAENVEKMISGRGDLEVLGVTSREGNTYRRVAHIGDETFNAFAYGKRRDPIPETDSPLLGVAMPATEKIAVGNQVVSRSENLLALREDRFRVLSKAEVALTRTNETTPVEHHCPVSGDATTTNSNETAVDVGGEVVWLCKDGHVAPFTQDESGHYLAAATGQEIKKAYAGGPGEGAGSFPSIPANWSTGSKRLIAMPIRFPEQAANPFGSTDINGAVSSSCTRLNQWSYGRVSFTYTLTGIITLPRSMASYASSGGEDAMTNDAISIANSQGYNASGANFHTVIFTGSYGNYCGLGQIVGSRAWIKCIDAPTITHEVGHNLGLPHANSWTPNTSNPIGAGSHCEYCGAYNTMGQGGAAYDTMMRFYLRWLTYTEAYDVNASGTYRIYDPEQTGLTAGRKHTIRVAKQAGQFYFVEFRPRATALSGNGSVDGTTQNGVRILRTDGSEQLDLTPGSANGLWDAAITSGQSFTDPGAGITISAVAKGGSGTAQYMDVSVSFSNAALFSGGVYELQPQCAPGSCLDVSGGQDANGANVQIWAGHGGVAEQWKLEDQGGGFWELIPVCATGRRLDVNAAGTANGTNVQIWQDFSNTAQRWTITNVGGGYYELTPQCAPGSHLDVSGGGNANGVNVQIWGTNTSPAQRWRFLPTVPQNQGVYQIEPQCAPGKRMDVALGQDANGANVASVTANGNIAQQWRLEAQGDGWFEIIPQCAQTRRLDVNAAGTGDGTNIQIWQDFSNNAQRWTITDVGGGYFELVPQCATNSRADVSGSSNADGANIQLWGTNSSPAQRWRLYRQ